MAALIEAIDEFLFHCEYERALSQKTLKAYGTDLRQFVGHIGDDRINVQAVDRNDIRGYVRNLSDSFKTKTVKRKLASLKSFFSHLEFEDAIPVSPFRKLRISLKQEYLLPRAVPMQMVRRLFRYLYAEKKRSVEKREILRDIAVLEFMFTTGVRVSEAASLRKDNIDLRGGTTLIMGKGNRERIIPICNIEPLDALREYLIAFDAEISSSNTFFVNRDGRPLSEQSIRFMLRKRAREAGVSIHLTPHMLRHTVATQLVANGADIRQVQYLLGHRSILTTQIYTHVDAKNCRKLLAAKHPRRTMMMRVETL